MATTRRSFLKTLGLGQRGSSDKENLRLKAFLDGVPGEYFGWDAQGQAFCNQGFLSLFEIAELANIDAFSKSLEPADAIAFENTLARYKRERRSLGLIVKNPKDKQIRLNFRPSDIESSSFNILWAEDVTDLLFENDSLKKKAEDFEQQHIQYQQALQSINVPVCLHTRDGKMAWCNQAYADLFSSNIEDVIKEQTSLSLKSIKEKKKVDVFEKVKLALKENAETTYDTTSVISGKRHRFDLNVTPVPDMGFAIVNVIDKTFEESISADTKRTESAYNALLENMQTAVALYNADKEIIFYNSAYAKLWHLEEAWLNTRPKLGDVLEKLRETRRLPEQADFRSYKHEWLARFTKLIEPHSDIIVLPDGTVLRTQTIPNPAGGLMLISEDVTSNLELESSYNTLVAVQSETLNNLKEGVIVFGGDGRLKLWNPTYAELWGMNPEDLEGEVHVSKLAERSKHFYDETAWEDRYTRIVKVMENRVADSGITKRNDNKTLAYAFVPLPDGGSLFTYADITDTVNIEEALREKNRALETAEQLKSEFLANVSYQLRTPLNAIMGFNEILSNEFFGELNDKQKEYTRDIGEAGNRLKQLIDDVLDLTSIEAGVMALDKKEIDVCELLNSVKLLGEEWAMGKQIKLDINCAKSVGTLHADKQRLRQVLMHLLRNAISYTPEKGSITLTAKCDDEALKIIMSDTGVGISEEDKKRLFEPFEIGTGQMHDPSRTGAGLGLTLVRNIIALHKGEVSIESEEGKGTDIILTFPEST